VVAGTAALAMVISKPNRRITCSRYRKLYT
jgi:hypothetical protein